jgi:hypothetical protein
MAIKGTATGSQGVTSRAGLDLRQPHAIANLSPLVDNGDETPILRRKARSSHRSTTLPIQCVLPRKDASS